MSDGAGTAESLLQTVQDSYMARKDFYYNKAKQEGYRSRAAYKLIQMDEEEDLFSSGDTVVDLGAAPGGWMQVAAAKVGASGIVIGVDRQRFSPPENVEATVETVRGDLTDPETITTIRSHIPHKTVDVVVSDMAPEMTGEYSLDQARSVHLATVAFEAATELLRPGGHFVVKIFEGRDIASFRARVADRFDYVGLTSPDASRAASSERYIVAKRFINAPVDVGDTLDVTIESLGREGDGVATVAGYTLFVPETDVGETVTVTVDRVTARYGVCSLSPGAQVTDQ